MDQFWLSGRQSERMGNNVMYSSTIIEHKNCNVAKFSTLLSRYRERIYVMKSPLFGNQEENPSPMCKGHSYSCIIYLFLLVFFFFMREKIMRRAYSFSASYFSLGSQRSSSHRRQLRHRYDAASNISWRSSPPAGTIFRSYVLLLFAFAS